MLVKDKEIGVNSACKLFGVSKDTFYSCRDKDERFKEKHTNIKKFIEKIIKENSFYGVKRIKAELKQRYSIEIGRDVLGKLLKLWGLSLKRKVKRTKPSMIKKIIMLLSDKANILTRSNIIAPFQAISSDITELRCKSGKFYLCVHKDVFGQIVYGYSISRVMDTVMVKESLSIAIKKIKKLLKVKSFKERDIIFHQDQGSQYTSYDYVNSVLDVGRISFSTPGTPTENPGQESFFGRFKEECKDELLEIESFEEAKRFVENRLKYYNTRRLHTSINYQSPFSFTKSFLNNCLSGTVSLG